MNLNDNSNTSCKNGVFFWGGEKMETHLTVELIIQRDDKIFMIKRKNTWYMDVYYAFIGGHVEHNESLKQAGIREAFL